MLEDEICGACNKVGCDLKTRCGHVFHKDCVKKGFSDDLYCPQCQEKVSASNQVESVLKRYKDANFELNDFKFKEVCLILNKMCIEKNPEPRVETVGIRHRPYYGCSSGCEQ